MGRNDPEPLKMLVNCLILATFYPNSYRKFTYPEQQIFSNFHRFWNQRYTVEIVRNLVFERHNFHILIYNVLSAMIFDLHHPVYSFISWENVYDISFRGQLSL